MLKTSKIVSILIGTLLVLSLGFIDSANAESSGFAVNIDSPTEGWTVTDDTVSLSFSVGYSGHVYGYVESISVSIFLDGQLYSQSQMGDGTTKNKHIPEYGNLDLTGLSQGKHTVEIKAEVIGTAFPIGSFDVDAKSASVNFYVNLQIKPKVSIISLDEYKTNQAIVNITSDAYSIFSYSLDGQAIVNLPQNDSTANQYNLTLSNLTDGSHTLTAYAQDTFSNIGMAEKTFTVNTSNQPNGSFSTIAFAAGGVIAGTILVCVILLLYRKTKQKQTPNAA